jgi:hypothetical protein
MITTKTMKVLPVLELRHIRNIGSASLCLCKVAVNKTLQTLQKSLNMPRLLTSFCISTEPQNEPSLIEQTPTLIATQ